MKGLSYVFARIRNKKVDTTILLVVLILSNSLFTSYYFYSRNSADVVLHQKLSEIPYHAVIDISSYYVWKWFNYTLPLTNVLEYIDQNYSFVDTIGYIRSLPVLINITIKDPMTSELTNITDYVSLTAITSNFTNSKFSNLIDTSIPINQLNESEVLVDSLFEDYTQKVLSTSLIGKKLYVHHFYTHKNYTTEVYYIVGTFTVTHEELEERYLYYSEYYLPSESKFGMFITSQAALSRLLMENETLDNCNSKLFINFKFSFFSADRLEYVESELRKFKNKLTLEFQPFVYVSLYVTNAISEVRWWTTGRLISTIQSAFPVLVTAWVVLKFEFELSGIRRRREIATLKSRGYSNLNIISLAIV